MTIFLKATSISCNLFACSPNWYNKIWLHQRRSCQNLEDWWRYWSQTGHCPFFFNTMKDFKTNFKIKKCIYYFGISPLHLSFSLHKSNCEYHLTWTEQIILSCKQWFLYIGHSSQSIIINQYKHFYFGRTPEIWIYNVINSREWIRSLFFLFSFLLSLFVSNYFLPLAMFFLYLIFFVSLKKNLSYISHKEYKHFLEIS